MQRRQQRKRKEAGGACALGKPSASAVKLHVKLSQTFRELAPPLEAGTVPGGLCGASSAEFLRAGF